MEQIKDVFKAYDIAGVVVLHTPGFSEYLLKIDPTYSCARMENGEYLRVRAKLKEDFNGDKKAWTLKVGDTSNMLSLLATTTGQMSISLFKISKMVDEKIQAEHTDGGHTGSNQQNN